MRKYACATFLLIVILILSCREAGIRHTGVINPNGDSELALIMRDMYEDGRRMKLEILEGEKPEVLDYFETIHSASATEPEKVASKAYEMYADAYLNSIRMLDEAHADDVPLAFSAMVESCMNCHREMCPGPMVKIEKLRLPDRLIQ